MFGLSYFNCMFKVVGKVLTAIIRMCYFLCVISCAAETYLSTFKIHNTLYFEIALNIKPLLLIYASDIFLIYFHTLKSK